MKNLNALRPLSIWAKNNKVKSWIIIAILHVFMSFYALSLGLISQLKFDINLGGLLLASCILYWMLILIYPIKDSIFSFYRASYTKRKTIDLAVILCSFVAFVGVGNQAEHFIANINTSTFTTSEYLPSVVDGVKLNKKINIKNLSKSFKEKRIELKEALQNVVKEVKAKSLNFHHFAWFLLLSGLLVTALFILLIFVCNLSCSGMESLAGVVAVGGLVLIITGVVFAIKAILNNEKLRAKGKKNKKEAKESS